MGVYYKHHAEKEYNDDALWKTAFPQYATYLEGEYIHGFINYEFDRQENKYYLNTNAHYRIPTSTNRILYDGDEYGCDVLEKKEILGDTVRFYNKKAFENTFNYIKGSYIGIISGNRYDYPSDGRHTDGYWYVFYNSPPTTPSAITLPSSVSGNDSFQIQWNKSTDSDGDSITYGLQRKVNNGSFQLVYSGSTNRYTDIAQSSWNTVQYRVRAYDGSDYSSYRTSSVTIVKSFPELKIKINNQLKTPEDGWVKIGGQLREIEKIWTKINGQLREV